MRHFFRTHKGVGKGLTPFSVVEIKKLLVVNVLVALVMGVFPVQVFAESASIAPGSWVGPTEVGGDGLVTASWTDPETISGDNYYYTTTQEPAANGGGLIKDDLIAHWRLDEVAGSTTVRDSTHFDNHGVIFGATAGEVGVIDGAMGFDGVDDFVTNFNLQTSIFNGGGTFSMWVKPSSITGTQVLMDRNGTAGYRLQVVDGVLQAVVGGQLVMSNEQLVMNNWVHLVVVLDGTNLKIYQDGVEVATAAYTGTIDEGGVDLVLGSTGSASWFSGNLDDVKIFDRGLTASEIVREYHRGRAFTMDDGLVGWWSFDSDFNLQSSIFDQSVNDNAGTLMGGVTLDEAGQLGSAGSFDGVDDYVSIFNLQTSIFNGGGVLGMWVKPSSLTGTQVLLDRNGTSGYQVRLNGTAVEASVGGQALAVSGQALVVDTWSYITVMLDGTNLKIYQDGVEVATAAYTGAIDEGMADLVLGSTGSASWFSGNLDEVKIYNRVLSQYEIEAEYHTRKTTVNNISDLAPVDGTTYVHIRPINNAMTAGFERVLTVNYDSVVPEVVEIKVGPDSTTPNTISSGSWIHSAATGGDELISMSWTDPLSASEDDFYYVATQQELVNEGLVGWWPLEGDGTDSSGNGHDGTVQGAMGFDANGKFGVAGDFDGANDFVSISSEQLTINNEGTFSMWVKPSSLTGTQVLLDRNGTAGYQVRLNGVNIEATVGGQQLAINNYQLTINEWVHLVVVLDGTDLKVYQDGVEVASAAYTGTIDEGPADLILGSTGSASWYTGLADDIKIWNRALSSGEVAYEYRRGATGLEAWWKFDESSGLTAVDTTGNGHDGTTVVGGATLGAAGILGKAASFDGVDDVIVSSNDDYTGWGAITISAWIKPQTPQTWSHIITSGAFSLGIGGTTILAGVNQDGTYHRDQAGGITDNAWNHVVATYESGSNADIKIYIDGELVADSPNGNQGTGVLYDYGGGTKIGAKADYDYPGLIDDVRIYSRELSADEVRSLYIDSGAHLVGHWKLDETSGTTAVDSSKRGNNGTLTGGVLVDQDGVFGRAMGFDGVDDFVTISNLQTSIFNGGGTFSMWVKPSVLTGTQVLMDRNGTTGYRLQVVDGVLQAVVGGQIVVSSEQLVMNNWTHVVVALDGSTLKIYQDGVEVASAAYTGTVDEGTADLTLGSTGTASWYAGRIDDVKIFDTGLTLDQVAYEYNKGRAIHTDDGLVGWWSFDEASGLIAYDHSGQENDGTVTGGSTYVNEGKLGSAMQFDGVDDYVDVPDSDFWSFGGDDFAMSTWVNFDNNGAAPGLLGNYDSGTGDQWGLRMGWTGEGMRFWWTTTGQSVDFQQGSDAGWEVGKWYHVALVRNGDNWNIYRDGISIASTTDADVLPAIAGSGKIGLVGSNQYMRGSLDEVKVWKRTVTADDIKSEYRIRKTRFAQIDQVPMEEGVSYVHAKAKSGADIQGEEQIFVINYDRTKPTGGSIDYLDGYRSVSSVTATVEAGSDMASGMSVIDTDYVLEYHEATLTGGICGTYGAWTDAGVSETAVSTSYTFAVSGGKCYEFRYKVKDVAGNEKIYSVAKTLKVDTSVPNAAPLDAGASTTDRTSLMSGTWFNATDAGGDGAISTSWNANTAPSGAISSVMETTSAAPVLRADDYVGYWSMDEDLTVEVISSGPGMGWYLGNYANNYSNPGRFVNSDEDGNANANLVYDTATGLVWCRSGSSACGNNGSTATWSTALSYCKGLSYAGFTDWRLPDGNELNGIIDLNAGAAPYIYQGPDGFTNTVSNYYWSATTRPSNTANAFSAIFSDGYVANNVKTNNFYVRCVR